MVHTSPIRGDFPSLKLGRMVRYHSTIERDLLYFLEFWQAVTWYREQPMTIAWFGEDGKRHRYIPDYEIHESDRKILVECKPVARLDSAHAQQQRRIGQTWAAENNYHFVTYTDQSLREGHQLANLTLFWRYARLRDTHASGDILQRVRRERQTSVTTLCKHLGLLPKQIMPLVCHLLFHHHLRTDLQQPFTPTVLLEIGDAP